MAGVILKGNTSGQVELSVPAVAGTNVINVAAQSGTLHVAAPAVKAEAAGTQTISLATATKVTLSDTQNSECFDTNNCFASSTFTPTVAGYYQINASVQITLGTSITSLSVFIYKNGSQLASNANDGSSSTSGYANVSEIAYMNGTTDYIDIYGRATGSGSVTIVQGSISAALIRGA